MKVILILLISILSFADDFANFYPNNTLPEYNYNTSHITYSNFDIVYSNDNKIPLFVAEFLNGNFIHTKRYNKFHEDKNIDEKYRSTLDDYKNSKYDRGHMAPFADMTSSNAQFESFSLANMIPQEQECNRGAWSDIESKVRELSVFNPIYVITGPILKPIEYIGNNVMVPSHMYKIIYFKDKNEASAYLMENNKSCKTTIISIQELEDLTNIKYFKDIDKNKIIMLP